MPYASEPVGRVQAGAEQDECPQRPCGARELSPKGWKTLCNVKFETQDLFPYFQDATEKPCPRNGRRYPLDFEARDHRGATRRVEVAARVSDYHDPSDTSIPVRVTCVMHRRGEEGGATEHKHPLYYTPKTVVCQLLFFRRSKVCRIRAESPLRGPPVTTEATRAPRAHLPKAAPTESIPLPTPIPSGREGRRIGRAHP